MLTIAVLRAMGEILEDVITALTNSTLLPILPAELHHYAALETIQKILEFDDVRLSHAEYSNDQREWSKQRMLFAVA